MKTTNLSKRILAILMAIVLVCGLLPTSALAARIVDDEVQIEAPVETPAERPDGEALAYDPPRTIYLYFVYPSGTTSKIGSVVKTKSEVNGMALSTCVSRYFTYTIPSGYKSTGLKHRSNSFGSWTSRSTIEDTSYNDIGIMLVEDHTHNYSYSYYSNTQHKYSCSCGEGTTYSSHSRSYQVSSTPATCNAYASTTWHCNTCNANWTETGNSLATHTWGAWSVNPNNSAEEIRWCNYGVHSETRTAETQTVRLTVYKMLDGATLSELPDNYQITVAWTENGTGKTKTLNKANDELSNVIDNVMIWYVDGVPANSLVTISERNYAISGKNVTVTAKDGDSNVLQAIIGTTYRISLGDAADEFNLINTYTSAGPQATEGHITIKKVFAGLNDFPANFSITWEETHGETGDKATKILNLENANDVNENTLTVTWDVPHYYSTDSNAPEHSIKITENCDVTNYTYKTTASHNATVNGHTITATEIPSNLERTYTITNTYTPEVVKASYTIKHHYYTDGKLDATVTETVSGVEPETVVKLSELTRKAVNNGTTYVYNSESEKIEQGTQTITGNDKVFDLYYSRVTVPTQVDTRTTAVKASFYDVTGETRKNIKEQAPGNYTVEWTMTNAHGLNKSGTFTLGDDKQTLGNIYVPTWEFPVGYSDALKAEYFATVTFTISNANISGYVLTSSLDRTDVFEIERQKAVGDDSGWTTSGSFRNYNIRNTYVKRATVIYNDGTDSSHNAAKVFPDQKYTVNVGEETPEFVGSLVRPGYTFNGWSPEVADTVTENITYKAQWTVNKITADQDKDLTVTFVDGHTGEPFGQLKLPDTKSLYTTLYPKAPSHVDEGYKHTGWSEPVQDTDGNYTITANYEHCPSGVTYHVYFHWGHDRPEDYYSLTLPETMTVAPGTAVDLTNVAPDGVYDAEGNKIQYFAGTEFTGNNKYWTWDCWTDKYISVETVTFTNASGEMERHSRSEYAVTTFNMPEKDVNVYAQFAGDGGVGTKVTLGGEKRTVKWVDGYSENPLLQKETVLGVVNDQPIVPMPYPADPTRDGYTFVGWSEPVKDAEKDESGRDSWTITAQWETGLPTTANYTVKWLDVDTGAALKVAVTRQGTVGGTVSVEDADKTITGYRFAEENAGTKTSDTLAASGTELTLYFKKQVTVTWLDADGDTLAEEPVDKGSDYSDKYPDDPTETGKWNAPVTDPTTGDITIQWHEHDFEPVVDGEGNIVWKTEPTCTVNGEQLTRCECGEESKVTVSNSAQGHDFEGAAWVDNCSDHADADCTGHHRDCKRCGGTEDGGQEQGSHSFTIEVSNTATCTQDGVKTLECECGHTTTENVSATDHNFSTWVVTKPANCTENAEQSRTCSKCGEVETEVVQGTVLGHSFEGAAWVDDNNHGEHEDGCTTAQHRRECQRCHNAVERRNHNYGEWETITEATLTQTGLESRACQDCDHVQTQVIPTLAENSVTWYDEDGTQLDRKIFGKGTQEPAQTIADPFKEADDDNTYTFAGWTRTEDAQGNVTYTATYRPTAKPVYAVSWKNGEDVIATGETKDPTKLPADPTELPEAPEGKEFDGWDTPVVDEENKTITVQIKWKDKTIIPDDRKEVVVTWVNEDGKTVLDTQTFKEGDEEPTQRIENPTKAEDTQNTYTFDKWVRTTDDQGNITYTASFKSNPKNTGGNGGGGGNNPRPVNPPEEDLDDPDVPLANLPMLNQDDHFAYIIGKPDGSIQPMANITRAEVVTIFFRIMTEEARAANWGENSGFSDVSEGAWYNHAVCTTMNAGLIKGMPDGTFAGNRNITRAEFATIAARFLDTVSQPEEQFDDIAGHWAEEDINRATVAGWIKGVGDGKFNPNAYITRAEVMTLVNRMLNREFDEDHNLSDMVVWPDNMDKDAWYYGDVQEATNDHEYDRKAGTLTETWTKITEPRDWSELEK